MKGFKMANVLVTSDWFITNVFLTKDESRYHVTFQRLPESDHANPTYWSVRTSEAAFPAGLAKADFCANVVTHLNSFCSETDTMVSERTELYQD
tara:strand:- start:345 stop:626 length:282 start_codon:yes stop_codon:yes gene_type:complete